MPARPNILFLFPDQHRHDWLGLNRSLPVRTPNLDKLAAEGVRFTRAYCDSPVCAPSRAALAQGVGYDRCGVRNNSVAMPLDRPTFYQALRDAGYEVCGVGKFDLDKPTLTWNKDGSRHLAEWGFTCGIDNEGKFDGSSSYIRHEREAQGPYLQYLHDRGAADAYCREHRSPERKSVHRNAYVTCLRDEDYCDNWLSENGKRFLRGFSHDRPWFLQVNFTGPHDPMDVTQAMHERWTHTAFPTPHANAQPDYRDADHQRNRQHYAAMIENIDRQIGEFIELVRERGELDNTLIVYASDHGEMLGDHGRWGKSCWQEPSVGVPLIASGPGVARGAACDSPVLVHDLARTFLEYADAEPYDGLDAISLQSVLRKGGGAVRDHVVLGLDDWRACIDERWKCVVGWQGSQPMLFDLQNDPWEDHDVAGEQPGIIRDRIERIAAEQRVSDATPDPASAQR